MSSQMMISMEMVQFKKIILKYSTTIVIKISIHNLNLKYLKIQKIFIKMMKVLKKIFYKMKLRIIITMLKQMMSKKNKKLKLNQMKLKRFLKMNHNNNNKKMIKNHFKSIEQKKIIKQIIHIKLHKTKFKLIMM